MFQALSDKDLGKLRRYIIAHKNIGLVDKAEFSIEKIAEACGTLPKRIKEFEKGLLPEPDKIRLQIRTRYVEFITNKTKGPLEKILQDSRKYKKLTSSKNPETISPRTSSSLQPPPQNEAKPLDPVNKINPRPLKQQEFLLKIEGTEVLMQPGEVVTVRVLPEGRIQISLKK